MTKRKEIWEGIRELLLNESYPMGSPDEFGITTSGVRITGDLIGRIFQYLNDNDVVIKVDGELSTLSGDGVFIRTEYEPLIGPLSGFWDNYGCCKTT